MKATAPITAKRVALAPERSARPASPVLGGVMPPTPVSGAVTTGGGAGPSQVTVTCETAGGVEKLPPEATLPPPPDAITTSYGPSCDELVSKKIVDVPPKVSAIVLDIAAAIGVFFLLQAAYGSFRLAILSFVTLPSALVGGVLAAYLGDGVISLGSLVGFLTVLGIAARNGIMMINHFQHLERYEGEAFGPDLIIRGAQERIAPIMMTALSTGLALIPLVIAGSLPGHEIEHPMAIVILGGLVTSTLLNLFIVPPLYMRFAKGFFPHRGGESSQPA